MTQCDNMSSKYISCERKSCSPYIVCIRFANLYVLHEAVALSTARQGLPSSSDGREGDLHQLIHACKGRQTGGLSQDETYHKHKITKSKGKKKHFTANYLKNVRDSN